jgi:hypothetical protein
MRLITGPGSVACADDHPISSTEGAVRHAEPAPDDVVLAG